MKKLFFLFVALISIRNAYTQNVGIGTNTPNSSALLEVKSTTKGFLLPRMIASQRNAIVSPATGLLIYCTDCGPNGGQPQYYNGSGWRDMTGNPAATPWALGNTYQGGIIFYILKSNDPGYIAGEYHGLIAAPFDQSDAILWENGQAVTGATATALGTGNANTNTIIAMQGAGDHAASLCADLVLNGYSDWYLPSKDELNLLWINSSFVGPNFNVGRHWSSSEFIPSSSYAWCQDLTNSGSGTQLEEPKNVVHPVRAIRTF